MARNHKRVIIETLKKVKDMGMSVEFDNYKNGDFIKYVNRKGEIATKTWANSITIEGMTVEGLQAWDNGDFENMLMPLLREYKNKNITLEQLKNGLSGENMGLVTEKQNGEVKKEYAKDSYRWSQIDLIDRFYRYIDKMNTLENLKDYFKMIYNKCQACNPSMNGWTASRVEQVYLTHNIIPKFIINELGLNISQDDLKNLIHDYLYDFPQFTDNLHELIGDIKVKDDLFSKMGLI